MAPSLGTSLPHEAVQQQQAVGSRLPDTYTRAREPAQTRQTAWPSSPGEAPLSALRFSEEHTFASNVHLHPHVTASGQNSAGKQMSQKHPSSHPSTERRPRAPCWPGAGGPARALWTSAVHSMPCVFSIVVSNSVDVI